MTDDMAKQEAALAVLKPHELVQHTEERIVSLVNEGGLVLPPNYSATNALKSAWLKLQEIETRDHKPVLDVCTKPSIANAMLDMCIQGLNPSKDQCYFIAYGKKLSMMRSRFGNQSLAKRFGAKEIFSSVIYAGDEVVLRVERGNKVIDKHTSKFTNMKDANISGAYCTITFDDGRQDYTEIMTIDQIHKSWGQSKLDWRKADSTHAKFPVEMCRRTVENKACKFVIKSSNDGNLFLESFDRCEDDLALAAHDEAIEKLANSEELPTVLNASVEIIGDAPEAEETEPPKPWLGVCPISGADYKKNPWYKSGDNYWACTGKMIGIKKPEVMCRCASMAASEVRDMIKKMGLGQPEDNKLALMLGYAIDVEQGQEQLPFDETSNPVDLNGNEEEQDW